MPSRNVETKNTRPFIKWAGGKRKELPVIIDNFPKCGFKNYYEPFVGGGAVYWAVDAENYFINDKSYDLINLYYMVSLNEKTPFLSYLYALVNNWNMLPKLATKVHSEMIGKEDTKENLEKAIRVTLNNSHLLQYSTRLMAFVENEYGKAQKFKGLSDADHINLVETAFKSHLYTEHRRLLNNGENIDLPPHQRAALFFFVRSLAFGGMSRFNSSGGFNVPYGGKSYNKLDLTKKVNYLSNVDMQSHLNKTKISCGDFEPFIELRKPSPDDFMFLDPPYDTAFSTYDKNVFSQNDHKRLASYLLNKCNSKWMLVINNNDFTRNLYAGANLNTKTYDVKYRCSIKNRVDTNSSHLMITNYKN